MKLDVMSVAEVAEYIGVSIQAVHGRIQAGYLEAQLVGKTWIVSGFSARLWYHERHRAI